MTVRAPKDASPQAVLRPLFPMEHALWLTDQAFPTPVVVALHVTPSLDEGVIRQALDRLQARHAVLRAAITIRGRHPVFFQDPRHRPIELDVRPAGTAWRAVCTERLNGRVPAERAPLLDVVLVPGADDHGSALVVRLHHSLVDGWVLTHLLGELLEFIGRAAGGPENGAADGTATPPLQIGSLPAGPTLPSAPRRLRFLGREIVSDIVFRRATRGFAQKPVDTASTCRAEARTLSAEQTERLARACRRERSTMYGVLSAALLRATLQRVYGDSVRPMRAITFADMRPDLPLPYRESVGAHIGMLRLGFRVSASAPMSALADDCTRAIARSTRRGDGLVAAALSPMAMRQVLGRGTERMADTALSYLGPVSLPTHFGPHALADVHVFISGNPLGPVLSCSGHLFDRRLSLGFMTMTGDMADALAARLVDDVIGELDHFTAPR